MADVQYVNGLFIKEIGNYGNLSIGIKVDELTEQLQTLKNKNGYANIVIKKRKESSEKGFTHYAVVDTWQPNQTKDRVDAEDGLTEEQSDLPF